MKFKESIKTFFLNLKSGVSRFLTAFICSILCYLTMAYAVIFEPRNAENVIASLCITFLIVAVLSVLLKTIQEYITVKLKSPIQYIICTIAAIAGFLLIKENFESVYTPMAYCGIIVAFICFIFFIIMSGENRDSAFSKIVSTYVFAAAVCAVISIGLSTCIWAFESLIFTFKDSYKVYSIVLYLVWVVGFTNIFLTAIPKKDVPVQTSKIFRTFILYAGLPLYTLLISILLVYLGKIVVTFKMPVGEINWFASFASLFFIFFLLSVKQYKEKIAVFFTKYGGFCLLPVLIMQGIAVFERINAYGLTTPRTISLVLIFISILFIGGSIIAPKHFNKIALASGIIVLIVTITPFNVIDMPVASQTAILENVLIKNNMLSEGKVVPNADISDEDAEKILSSYDYLKYNAKKVPDFVSDSNKGVKEIFGITPKEQWRDSYISPTSYYTVTTADSVDISEYDKMTKIDGYNQYIHFDYKGEMLNINQYDLAKEFYEAYFAKDEDTYTGDPVKIGIYRINDEIGLYISDFHFGICDGEVTHHDFNGYLLVKE